MVQSIDNYEYDLQRLEISPSPLNSPRIKPVATKRFIEHVKNRITKKRRDEGRKVRWGTVQSYDSSLTRDEINRSWYNHQDLEVFQEEKRLIIKACKHVKGNIQLLEGTRYETRGFEHYQSPKFNQIIHQQRRVVLDSVLELQQRQRITSTQNPDEIASICIKHSKWARSWATDLGEKNAIKYDICWQDLFLKDVKTRTKYYSAEGNDMQEEKSEYRKIPASHKKTGENDDTKMLHKDNLILQRVPKYEWRRSPSPPVCAPTRSPSPPRYRAPQPPSTVDLQPAARIHHHPHEPEPHSSQLDPPNFPQNNVSCLFEEGNFEHSSIQVSPGVNMPLRGSQETQFAIQKEYIMNVNCMNCTLELSCVQNSQYVLCPLCHCITPLELSGVRLESNAFGVGLGFVEDGI
mmetsp:Transcript_9250/g.14223  ORF Transcript_9250/g.14223 Transcript_9250/m.14223 type:complete len:405 (-) Transcript_9250:362-1576(-)